MKSTTRSLRALKGVRPIVCLTAYDVSTARIADAGGADLILVGDSLGNAVLGLPDTVGVTMDMMIHHASAVVRAKTDALVVGDLPFGLAHDSFPKLLGYCRRFLQEAGVKAVKIEGGRRIESTASLTDALPTMLGILGVPYLNTGIGRDLLGLGPKDPRFSLIGDNAVLDDDSDFKLTEAMPDNDSSVQRTNSERQEALHFLMENLRPRERKVLDLRFGLTGAGAHSLAIPLVEPSVAVQVNLQLGGQASGAASGLVTRNVSLRSTTGQMWFGITATTWWSLGWAAPSGTGTTAW